MHPKYEKAIAELKTAGWVVQLSGSLSPLSPAILRRYPWLPSDYVAFIESIGLVASADDKVWIQTAKDFNGQTESAFAWNEWELQSLAAAKGDPKWTQTIKAFWDNHFPVLMSVRSGYAYCALDRLGEEVVRGREPEYEKTTVVCRTVDELLHLVATPRGDLALFPL